MAYIRGANPIWYMVDHVGQPLNDEYYAFFLANTFPYTPQPPARDPNGLTFWTGGIVQFEPSGTLPNNLYFNDELTYRIEIRHGNTQSDELIWEINNYQPAGASITPDSNLSLTSDNQASNGQFSYVSFNNSAVITTSGDHEIAPGWFLELTGSGSVTVTQIRTISGSNNIPGNPAYALRLLITGWTTAFLRQRFEQNGSLFAGTNAIDPSGITMSVTARANDNIQHPLRLLYRQEGETAIEVANGNLDISDYAVIDGAIQLELSANSNVNPDSYTDMLVELPILSADISLTNLQVVGEFMETTPVALPFEQEPVERQLDHLFHYYADSILRQPKTNLLSGWIFANNPWQFRTTSSSNVANNTYTADQTIVIQQAFVATATGNNIAVGRGSAANNYSFEVTAVTANNQFGVLQYIDPSTIRPYWNGNVSSLLKSRIATSHSSVVKVKARLIHRTSLPSAVSQTEPVASWAAGGDPVFAAGWTAITPLNDPSYSLTGDNLSFAFDKFTLPASGGDNMTLGLFVYTVDNMNETATADKIHIEKVSLLPNDFAIEAAPETYDESKRRCEFYYEKSYADGSLPGAATVNNQLHLRSNTASNAADQGHPFSFQIYYNTVKRAAPTLAVFTPAGVGSNIEFSILRDGSIATGSTAINQNLSNWTVVASLNRASLTCTDTQNNITQTAVATAGDEATQKLHYTLDARLGI